MTTNDTANDLIFAASASGPLWQDLLLCQQVAALASAMNQDITLERETDDGYFRVKVKGR